MIDLDQRTAAAKFAQDWHERGNEKSDTQSFWLSLLANVFGVKSVTSFIQFEKSVERLGHAGYIDAYIPSTKVLIEQKSLGIDLDKAAAQSGGKMLTPFEQAKEYADNLSFSEKPRWIVVSDFATFRVHDMEKPHAAPEVIELKNLAREAHRLKFLVNSGIDLVKREEELSIAAGRIIGELYDAFLKPYGDNPTEDDLRNLNVLCVRIVFCLYAEDAGILPKNAFHDYLNRFISRDIPMALRDFFETLNTPIAERGRFLDPDLARLPYVNGGLFGKGGEEPKSRQVEEGEESRNRGVEEISSVPRLVDSSVGSSTNPHPRFEIPPFSTAMRQLLLEKASLNFDWSAISPTIFGAVFESILNPETRRKGGMHYTSVENIHKVNDPLFLDALWREFREIVSLEESKSRQVEEGDEPRNRGAEISSARRIVGSSVGSSISRATRARLLAFQSKLASLTFLDPACGSGNFLTETYLSLRRLENEVLRVLLAGQSELDLGDLVKVSIHQFYGIEINDFAVTVAKTALWIAESQMLKETEDILHRSLDFLPLKTYSNIVEANALTLDWESVVPRSRLSYIIGNPPFVGYSLQSKEQKDNMLSVYVDARGKPYKTAGKIDFVAGWYFKACQLMQGTNIRTAFVSTNSICQGEQVAAVWKPLVERFGLQIDFAWRTFRWDSESIGKAHVHCVIVGFSCREEPKSRGIEESKKSPRLVGSSVGSSISPKTIFDEQNCAHRAANINPYLIDAPDIFIESRSKPICAVPEMTTGNRPADGGHLIIEAEDYEDFLRKEPGAKKFIKKFTGSAEYINDRPRWCLWLKDAEPGELRRLPEVMKRIEACRNDRLNSPDPGRRQLAITPWLFREQNNPDAFIIVPKVSSEQRRYVPMGFMGGDTIASDLVFVIPNATLYHFGVLTSSVHMAWMRAVCGRLKSDYRYSKDVVYNNFPWPEGEVDEEPKSRQVEESEEPRNRGDEISSARRLVGSSVGSSIKTISQTAQAILDARARYPDSSLADLYDELTMPPDLRAAHLANDRAVMAAYGFPQNSISEKSASSAGDKTLSESEIVAELMRRYQTLVGDSSITTG